MLADEPDSTHCNPPSFKIPKLNKARILPVKFSFGLMEQVLTCNIQRSNAACHFLTASLLACSRLFVNLKDLNEVRENVIEQRRLRAEISFIFHPFPTLADALDGCQKFVKHSNNLNGAKKSYHFPRTKYLRHGW